MIQIIISNLKEGRVMRNAQRMSVWLMVIGAVGISVTHAQITTTLNADGPGDTYELVNSVFGSGAAGEVPDLYPACNHSGVRHISEAWDSTLNKYVFLFDMHVDSVIDYDRCANTDRQRNEIKTVSPETITGQPGETHIYKWKFKIDSLFQPSPNFCHLYQIKATGGDDDGAPLMTITPRKYSDPNQPEWLQLIFTPSSGGSGGGTVKQVELQPLKGQWLDVTQKVIYSDQGKYELTIKRLDGTVVMYYSNYFLDMYRAGANFHRGKWGIYRSLNSQSYLRDETVAFADFEIIEGEVNAQPVPPGGIMATAISNRQVDLGWSDNSDNETNFLVQRSLDGVNWSSIAAVDSNITVYSDKGLSDSTQYYYRVRAENWNAYSNYTDSTSAVTFVSNALLPPSWNNQDIGSPSLAGSASGLDGVFTVEGAGSDVFGTSDQFHYLYRVLSGDGSITARVDSIAPTHEWAKAGVMIRAALTNNSAHAMNILTPLHGVSFQRRAVSGGSSSSTSGSMVKAPYWVQLRRHGEVLAGYESADGLVWTQVGSETIPMPTTVYAGLMLTSHASASLGTAVFSHVSMTTDSTGDPHIWREAESTTITAPMKLKEDYLASAGSYAVTDTGKNTSNAPTDGHLVFQFNVAVAGLYKIWARVKAPTTDDDSFWVKVDEHDWVSWNEVESSEEWIWDEVHNSNNNDTVVTYELGVGTHTATFAYREDGTLLDKVLITSDLSFDPNPAAPPTGIEHIRAEVPQAISLSPAYPNPFNPATNFEFRLETTANVTLQVYDMLGREVASLVDDEFTPGVYRTQWDASGFPSGVYYFRLQSDGFGKTRKVILLK